MSKDPFKANLSISNTLIPKDTFAEKLRKYQLTESFAVDEKKKENKKKQSWWKELTTLAISPSKFFLNPLEFNKALEYTDKDDAIQRGTVSTFKSITADIPQSVGEMFITDPYGYSFGDLNLDTKDPNHKEYVDAYNFIENYKKTTNPFIGGDEGTKLLQSNGFENSFFGNQGVQTKRSDAEVKNILENSVISEYTGNMQDWYNSNPYFGIDTFDVSDTWTNKLLETVPQFATQLLATIYGGPVAGMSYSGGLMFSDTYQNARPYVLKGELDVNEAHRLATTVGLVSFATNYAPSYVYSAYVKQPKLFKDILFNKFYQKGLHKNLTIETFKGKTLEGLQEGIDEFTSLTAESTYRNISSDEWWDRITTSSSIGSVLGGGTSVTLAHINNKNVKKEIIPKIIETENLLLPDIMKVDAEGNFKVDIKEENFSTKEDYENAKAIVDNPDFKNKIDPYKIAEKNRQRELDGEQEVPLNMMIFNELNIDNPNTDDIDIVYNAKSFTSIMTDKELISKNYDPEEFISGEIKKGDSAYEEGKRKFKVWTLGSNIYNSSGGRILLTEGANQDVFVEEIVESLFKKLSTTNPELKQKIDKWIVDMGNLLDENKIGGVRGIELFSKWYTFNYLGYANQETDLKDVVALPEDIVKEFDKIMGEQKDGANVSFLFKGGDPIAEKQLEEFDIETKTEEITPLEETPEESFRLTPQQEEFFKDSKVRDSGGNPYAEMLGLEKNYLLKVYHGTKNDFEEFKFLDSKTTNEHYAGDLGFWFTSEPKYKSTEYDEGNAEYMASEWANKFKDYGEPDPEGANVIPAYLNLKNPIEIYGYDLMHTPLKQQLIDTIKNKYNKDVKSGKEIREALLSEGIDGVHIIESFTDGNVFRDDWVAFKPEQIKSQFNVEPTSDPRMSFRIVPVDAGESKGTFFIAGDPANLNLEGEQEDFGIRYPDTHKGWAVSQVPATKIKKQVDAGNNVIVITSMSDAKKSMMINPTYKEALKRDGIEKVGEEQFNKLLEKHDGDIFKASKEAGVNQTEIAKQVAVPDFEQIKGKIVAVATVKDIRTGDDRNYKHPVYPYEINFDTYYRLPEPIDFDTYLKDLPDYTNKQGKVISRSQWGKLMANTYNLSVLRSESELNQKLINFANTGDYDALGVETKGFQMASPQVEEIGLDEAVSKIKSKETINYHRIKADLEVAMGLVSTTKSAVGEWETGAEPSIVTEVTGDVTMEQLNLLGAMSGILGTDGKVGQLQILNFVAKKDGPHTAIKVDIEGNIKDITKAVKQLNDIGLTFKTLPITGNKFNLLFVDMDGNMLNLVKEIYNEQKITTTKGEANFIGSDKSRLKSEKIFLDIINKDAKKYPELGKQFRKSIANHRPRFDNNKLTYRLTSKPSLHLDPPTVLQNIATRLQDQMLRLKVVQEKIGEIPEDQDAYMQSELFIGTATEKIDNFRNETLEPLIKELTDAGFTIDELGDYLYAKHSDERNKLINERNAEEILEIKEKIKNSKTEKTKQKYIQTLKELESKGSGMTQEDITLDDGTVIEGSKTILKKYKDTNIDQFADRVYDILNQRLDILYNNGMITKEDYDYFKSDKLFKNYVPLKGLPGDNTNPQIGKGFSILGKDIKKARGRESRANNPFVQTLLDFEESIVRTEKNKVTEAFYNLVIANPSDIWSAKGVKHIPRFNEWGDFQYLDPIDLKPNEIEVKIEGKRKIITINDPALLRSMQKLGSGKSIAILNGFNTFFRAINTTINPEFIITNFERDLQTGLFNLSADHKGLTKQVMKNVFKAQKGIWDNVKGKDSEWAKIYQEYKDNGGKIGWFDQMSLEDKTNKLESLLKKYKSKNMVGNSLRASKKLINDINEVVESGVRLSTYKALVDAGVSPKKSAQYSKNLTVNFNKKGEWGSWLNSLYVFSNAGIQGTTRVLKMAKTKRGKKIIGGLMAFGFMQSFLNRLIDDEEWEQFSDYNKDNYWMFMLPNGKCLSIKAPYGFNVFKTAGGLAEELMFGDLSLGDASKRLLKAIDDGFNPMGGGSPLQILSPTISDPFFQLIENKNFFGGPIMPEQPPYAPKVRDSKRYFKGARKIPKAITEWLNKITGGSEDVAGWIDVSPETIDHLTDAYTGGVGKFVANAVETGTSLAIDGKFPTANNLPIVRQFYKETDEWTSRSIVYDMINESGRKKFSKKERQKFSRHINYLKKGDFDRDKYTYTEWIKYLDEQNNTMSKNQSNLK